jgi:hypothetical protein
MMNMNDDRFDRLTRTLSHLRTRRHLATALGLVAVATGAFRSPSTQAKNNKNKKRKKLQRNKYGCVDVGGNCRGRDNVCCSGICDGKKPKKGKRDRSTCIAHNVLDCPPGADECQDVSVACGTTLPGTCFQTTGRASFCAFIGTCKDCQKDADCGAGGACAVCPGCGGISDTACLAPAA